MSALDDHQAEQRELSISSGTWAPWAEAQPVREHVQTLIAVGQSWKRTAVLARVAPSTVSRLLYGTPRINNGRAPTVIRSETAKALLAVQGGHQNLTPGGCVDSTGSRRRIQALIANGWSLARLADQLGTRYDNLRTSINRPALRAATAEKITNLYDRLWDTAPPNETEDDRTSSTRARTVPQPSAGHHRWPGTTKT